MVPIEKGLSQWSYMQISNYSTMANIGNIMALHNLYMANIYKSLSKIEKNLMQNLQIHAQKYIY